MNTLAATTATATGSTPDLDPLLILIGIIWFIGYVIACAIWPFRSCTKCHGFGKFLSPTGRGFRYCRKCNGRGSQLRIGRRVWSYLKNTRDRDRRSR